MIKVSKISFETWNCPTLTSSRSCASVNLTELGERREEIDGRIFFFPHFTVIKKKKIPWCLIFLFFGDLKPLPRRLNEI